MRVPYPDFVDTITTAQLEEWANEPYEGRIPPAYMMRIGVILARRKALIELWTNGMDLSDWFESDFRKHRIDCLEWGVDPD